MQSIGDKEILSMSIGEMQISSFSIGDQVIYDGGSGGHDDYTILPFVFDGNSVIKYTGDDPNMVIPSSYSLGDIVNVTKTYTETESEGSGSGSGYTSAFENLLHDLGYSYFNDTSNYPINLIVDGTPYILQNKNDYYNLQEDLDAASEISIIVEEQQYIVGKTYNVTSIHDSAFSGNSKIHTATIPSSIMDMGYGIFEECRNLTSVSLPNSILRISDYAFYGTGLTSVTIPNSVTAIGYDAFGSCRNLMQVTLGTGLIDSGEDSGSGSGSGSGISSGAFNGCERLWEIYNLSNIELTLGSTSNGMVAYYAKVIHTSLDEPSSIYTSDDFILCNDGVDIWALEYLGNSSNVSIPNTVTKINNKLFYENKTLQAINIPNSVIDIGDYAFQMCSNISSVTLGSNIVNIGKFAFQACTSITSITLPNSVTTLGEYAFGGATNLATLVLSNNLTTIPQNAFNGCKISSLNIPNSVTVIGSGAFNACSQLRTVSGGDGVITINGGAFGGCTGLESIYFGDSVTTIATNVLNNTPNLTSLVVSSNNVKYDSRNNCNCLIETSTNKIIIGTNNSTIPNSITEIGANAFANCTGLISIDIPYGVTTIEQNAFYGCSGLTSFEIPSSVTSIGGTAFQQCTSLTSMFIPDSVINIGTYTFTGCSNLETISFGTGITAIGNGFFENCTHLATVNVNSINPPTLSSSAFNRTNNTFIIYVPENSVSAYKSASVWSGYASRIQAYVEPTVKPLSYFTIMHDNDHGVITGLSSEGQTAYNIGRITGLYLPITYSLDSSNNIINGNDYQITSIANSAFENLAQLNTARIPVTVTSIGNNAFNGCSNLDKIEIMSSAPATLGTNVFANTNNCPIYVNIVSVETYKLASGWSTYASRIDTIDFSYPLQYFNISTDLGSKRGIIRGFSESGVTAYDRGEIVSITFPTTCSVDNSHNVIEGTDYIIKDINTDAFKDKINLKSINIPSVINMVAPTSFSGCIGLISIKVDPNNTVYDSRDNCNAIVKTAENSIIVGCAHSSIPNSITKIDTQAFYKCTNLTSIILTNNITAIGANSFGYCSGLTEVIIPSSITNIDSLAFQGCSSLNKFTFESATPPTLGSQIFQYHTPNRIYVPSEGLSTYRGNNKLSYYSYNIYAIPPVGGVYPISYFDITHNSNGGTLNGFSTAGETAINNHYVDSDCLITLPGSYSLSNDTIVEGTTYPIKNIANEAFFENYGRLKYVVIGNNIERIGDAAFESCSLISVEIPNTVTTLVDYAFSNCINLTSITIPNSVIYIGSYVFQRTNLTEATFVTTTGWKAGTTALSSVDLSNVSTAADYLKTTYVDQTWTHS